MRGPSLHDAPVRPALLVLALALGAAGCAAVGRPHAVPVTVPGPATLTADLYTPSGPGPFPAVILLHGCSGLRPNGVAWALWLRSEGYAALVLDSFSGRGLRSLCGNSAALRGAPRSNDVFAAAAYLRLLPAIDGERMGVMGFSHGGWAVLWAGESESRHPGVRLKALVAFYPSCGDLARYRGSAPLLMLLGGQDDWTPAEPCRLLAETSRREGRTVSVVLYPEARHAFDAASLERRTIIREARGGRGATVEYDPRAHADAEAQVRRFLREHLLR